MNDAKQPNNSVQAWHALTQEEAAKLLSTDPSRGLNESEVSARQGRYGFNEVAAKQGKHPLVLFLMQFNQPLIYVLLFAGVVTLFLKDWVDAAVIFGVTIINSLIGFFQESKAENAIAALAKTVTTEATVVRNAEKTRIPSRELVPGDVVILASGDKVPADMRLLNCRELQINESALTGESLPVTKRVEPLPQDTPLPDRINMAYGGTLVSAGQGQEIVIATGSQTETGKISVLISESTELETPLTKRIKGFSQTLLRIILGMAALTFLVALARGLAWGEGFKAAVALAVAAIPEGLPAVVTITLAVGVARMAQRNAIIRKLPAVETLGSTTVICSDKTGTLTENEMTVQHIFAGGNSYTVTGVGYGKEGAVLDGENNVVSLQNTPALRECLLAGMLCNDSHLQEKDGRTIVAGDPTEGALLVAAGKAGLDRRALETSLPRIDTLPFDSDYKYMATLHKSEAGTETMHCLYVKGSFDVLLPKCSGMLNHDGGVVALDGEEISRRADAMAKQGLRVLGFAKKTLPREKTQVGHNDMDDLLFLGIQGMIDPPREEAIQAVKACQTAGIKVKMITGDHVLTASAIAEKLHLNEGKPLAVFTGNDLAQLDPVQFVDAAHEGSVFARVTPEQKLRLVQALQSKNEVTAMTGDGVNDAPALKQADIGVAMGRNGTEVAKEAADMVLADDNFASIEAAVEEGRTVYHNLLKAIGYILPVNGGESMTILAGMLLASALPVLPVQILWVNMVSSVALTTPLAFDPKSPRVMLQPPRRPDEPLLSRNLLIRILVISLYNLIAVFGVFEWYFQSTGNLELARTMAVQTLVTAEAFYLLSVSRLVPTLLERIRGKNSAIAFAPALGIVTVIFLQLAFSQIGFMNRLFHTIPIGIRELAVCILAGAPVLIPATILKRYVPMNWG